MNTKPERAITVSLAEILYYISFSSLLLAKGLGFYDGQTVFKICLVISVIAWAGKMWLTEYTGRELISVAFLVGLGGIVYLVSGEKGVLLYVFMITGLKNVSIRKVFAVGVSVWTVFFMGFTWLNALHLVDGPFKVHEKLGMGMIIRWGLGQSHPNVLHISFFILVMFWVYLLGDRFNWKKALLFMAGNVIVYLYSVSSTGIIAVSLYLLLSLYWRYHKKINVVEQILIQLLLPACILYSLMAPILLQGSLFDKVNDITNTRLILARRFLTENPVTLFGTKLSEIITSQLTMDNSYVYAFVTYGIILFVIAMGAYFLLIQRYCKAQKGKELCVILTCLVAGVMEPFLFNTSYKNISLLFMKELLFEEKKEAPIRMPLAFSREYTISTEGFFNFIEKCKRVFQQRKRCLIVILVPGILAGSLGYQMLKKEPHRILVPESVCDVAVIQRTGDSLETAYLTSENHPPMETDEVIGYVNADERMIIYSGGIVKMEHIRGLICSGITTGAILLLAVMLFFYLHDSVPGTRGEKHEQDIDC